MHEANYHDVCRDKIDIFEAELTHYHRFCHHEAYYYEYLLSPTHCHSVFSAHFFHLVLDLETWAHLDPIEQISVAPNYFSSLHD